MPHETLKHIFKTDMLLVKYNPTGIAASIGRLMTAGGGLEGAL